MKFWRVALSILIPLSALPVALSWGPWYLLALIPVALILLSLRIDMVIARKERKDFQRTDATTIGHAYRG